MGRLINTSDRPVLLRRSRTSSPGQLHPISNATYYSCTVNSERRAQVGLGNIDIKSCEVPEECKRRMVDLVLQYEDIFVRHHPDCGEVKGFKPCDICQGMAKICQVLLSRTPSGHPVVTRIVSRGQKTKAKWSQYVVPERSSQQFRSLSLTRQRFFWSNLDRNGRDYVCHCQ